MSAAETIHLRHYLDGYPLCWPMDREGDFLATEVETKVTCDDCIDALEGDPQ